jgi:hypothetical protein
MNVLIPSRTPVSQTPRAAKLIRFAIALSKSSNPSNTMPFGMTRAIAEIENRNREKVE